MKNPYEVLGIKQDAGKDEIKEAYRALVKKYHPDQYVNHPLSNLAQEKMKEINEAYETLMDSGNPGSFTSYSNQGYSSSAYDDSSADSRFYRQVRSNIQSGYLEEADRTLESITARGAEWNYLKGVIMVRRGWYDQALYHFQIAVNLEPRNPEYVQAYNSFGRRTTTYRETGSRMSRSAASDWTCISNICLANCCLSCMGGRVMFCC